MSGEIVVGVGGNGSGFAAARAAARVASLMNVPLVIVFGYEAVAMGPRGGALEEEIAAVGGQAAADISEQVCALYPNLTVEISLVGQRPVDALIDTAQTCGAEAIVVGHGGSGPLKAALLGSITYEIVHRSPLPVLVVPDDESDFS